MICTGETYKKHLRLTFGKGPLLKEFDTKGLINSYRAMIILENDYIDEVAFKELIKSAVALNVKLASEKKSKKSTKSEIIK